MAEREFPFTDAEFEDMMARATARGAQVMATEPRALAAYYDREEDRIVVILTNGWEFGFKPWMGQGLEDATPDQLAKVELLGSGVALHWEELDADLGVDQLLAGRYGSMAHMARVAARYHGRQGGQVKSEAKARAARANGAKGGRPRKRPPEEFASAAPDA